MSQGAAIADPAPTVVVPLKGPSANVSPRQVDPDPKDIVLCTYPDTLDGFFAAWVVRHFAMKHNIPVEFSSTGIGESNVAGRNVIEIASAVAPIDAKSVVVISDGLHAMPTPRPFATWERTFPFGVKSMTDAAEHIGVVCAPSGTKTLTLLAWDFFNAARVGSDKPPKLLQHLNDYLTSSASPKFADTPAIYACLDSYPRDFVTFSKLVEACEDRVRRGRMVDAGQGIIRMLQKLATMGSVRVEVEK